MSLSDISIERPVLTWMMTLALATFGHDQSDIELIAFLEPNDNDIRIDDAPFATSRLQFRF